ncbi:hypothetical protein OG762_43320 [Streptomyces sp. NBC_01136]|nr:hypothetical protein OG762_43320 [Streptomyces sp. NBC_01136]
MPHLTAITMSGKHLPCTRLLLPPHQARTPRGTLIDQSFGSGR